MADIWASSANRAEHCRRQARRLRRIAETEPEEDFRGAVLGLALQYERIAAKIDSGVEDPAVVRLAAAASQD